MAILSNDHEAELLSRIQQGDNAAFATLFRQHYRELVITANRFVKNTAEAEDIVQELFYSIWKHRGNLPDHINSVAGYLHRSTRNRALNYLRDQQRIPSSDGDLPLHMVAEGLPSDGLDQQELQQRLHQAIDRLPERCRLVFTMSKIEEMSHQEIADALGISPKTIENQMTKAYRFLREWLAIFLWMLLTIQGTP